MKEYNKTWICGYFNFVSMILSLVMTGYFVAFENPEWMTFFVLALINAIFDINFRNMYHNEKEKNI